MQLIPAINFLFRGFLIVLMVSANPGRAQSSAGSHADLESRWLTDTPTAGILRNGSLALDIDCFQEGGLLTVVSIGLFDRLSVGVSYGGTHIIGADNPDWNEIPGFYLRVRILDESLSLPALAVGFDNQGKESYIADLDRYTIKSPGFYLVASKNYEAFGYLSFHGGLNYSLERTDGDRDPNLFVGAEKTLGSFMSAVVEYNAGINDGNREALGKGRGYLNLGLRVSIGTGFTIAVNIKDIARNQQDISVGNRTLTLEYVGIF